MALTVFRGVVLTLGVLISLAPSVVAEPVPVRDLTTEQVTSRQLETAIASRTLTWLTGSAVNNDYVSVGRIANFFGFVGLRVASGHTLSRSDVAFDTLAILDPAQRQQLIALTEDLSDTLTRTHVSRKAMNRALEGLLIGEPISRVAFDDLAQAYAAGEAQLGGIIAARFGEIASTLRANQIKELNSVRAMHVSGQGHLVDLAKPKIRLSKEDKKELVNTAARFLSWTTGSPAYNDFEVVGKPSQHFGFVSLRIESNHGVKRGGIAREVEQVLTVEQRALIEEAAQENMAMFEEFLAARADLLRYLETALEGSEIDLDRVEMLGRAMGAVEADMTWSQAQTMLSVRDRLSEQQVSDLMILRNKYTAIDKTAYADDLLVRGKQLYAQCALCHNSPIAPDLAGIVGRAVAADPGFLSYSPAFNDLADEGAVWLEERLDAFLAAPQRAVPGTTMGFSGLERARDREAIIAFLETLD